MKYTINDRVKILEGREYANGDSIKAGTEGTITVVYVLYEAYLVIFEGAKIGHRVLEKHLEEA